MFRKLVQEKLNQNESQIKPNNIPFFPTKRNYPHEFWKENLRINARVLLGYTYIYTYLSLGERHPMRCPYFRLQRNFLCYMPNYPYIFCKAFCYLSTPFWMASLLYVHISFAYMFIHLRGNFMLYIYSHIFTFIWRTISCCTFIEKANFVLLIFTWLLVNFVLFHKIKWQRGCAEV